MKETNKLLQAYKVIKKLYLWAIEAERLLEKAGVSSKKLDVLEKELNIEKDKLVALTPTP